MPNLSVISNNFVLLIAFIQIFMSNLYQNVRKAWGLLCLTLLFCASANGQVTLPHYDSFDYTVGASLSVQTGWAEVATNADLITVSSGNLSIASLPASIGNKIGFTGGGMDVFKGFTSQNAGTVYYSFLFRVTDLSYNSTTPDVNGGYFMGFIENASTTNFGATAWVKKDGTGFQIGTEVRTANAANTTWTTGTPYTINTTYLIVVSYTFNSGNSNDVVKLWVNPANTGTEPAATLTDNHTGTDLASAARLLIRQDSDTETPTTEIDELRIGTTWTSVMPPVAADVTPPTFAATFPKAQNINNTTFDLLSNINEVGNTYFVVLPDGATAPTAAQIKAGQNNAGAAVANNLKGTINHNTANTDVTANVTGLTANTAYDVYAVAEDLSVNLNTAVKVDVTTASGDILPPVFANTFPKASAIALTTFTLSTQINEIGKTYFVILPDNATAPTSAQVKAGQNGAGTAVANNLKGTIDVTTANLEFILGVTGLTETTAYDVYVVAEDAIPNLQASPVKIDVTTATSDNTAPTFTATYPKTAGVASSSFNLLTNINEAGKTYFVVLPDNATAPTAAQVKAGQNGAGTAVAANRQGVINNVAGATEYSANVGGLTQATSYDVYVVAEDAPPFNAPNLQASPVKVDVTTIAPNTNDIVEDFTTCTTGTNIGTWTRASVTGAQEWSCTTFGRTGNAAQMNGFAGTNNVNEDWLISPALDLSAFSSPNFSFWSASRFAGAPLTLRVSTNYTSGAPSTATWVTVTAGVNFPNPAPDNTPNWTESKDIDLTAYKSSNTRLAFVYTSTATDGTRWSVDDLKVYNKAPQIILTKAQTLDVVTWNIEWFGDNTNGPTDEVLQRNNIKSVIQQIDADMYCFQEVTNQNGTNSFQTLVTELQPFGYSGVRVTHTSGFGDAQQARAFIYKTATFSNVTTEVLTLGSTWVDGRQPVVFKGDATIEGTTKTFYFVNIHAKAGGTNVADFTQREANATALKTYLDGTRATDNVVFLGDFNDDLDMSIISPNNSPYKAFVDDAVRYATPSKTELSDKNITTFIGQTQPIDHIILSNEVATMYYNNSLKREDYTNIIANYANTTTDHYPVSVRLQIGTVTPDATAPTFTATFPKVSEITTASFKVESSINEAGKTYYVVVANNAPAPTAAQVKAGIDGAGNPVANNFKGTLTQVANLPASAQVTGITILTDYDVYFVAEDEIPNLQASPVKVDMTAAPADIVPPTFTATYPKADQIISGGFRLTSNLNEAGKTYYVVLPNNATEPTPAQVKAGQDATNTSLATNLVGTINNTLANTDYNRIVTGLNINTDYDVYFVADDLFMNLQTTPTKVDVKTAQLLFTNGYPKVDNITSNLTSARFRVVSSLAEVGKTYFVVLPNNASAPTSAQVKAGQDATGAAVNPAFLATLTNATVNAEVTANVIGADLDKDYDVYFVAENAGGALQPAPVKIDVKTPVATSAEDDIARYLSIYPNPAQDKLTVVLANNPILKRAEARLVNLLGTTAQVGKLITTAENNQYLFEVNTLPAGVYMLELQDGKNKFFRKVVVR